MHPDSYMFHMYSTPAIMKPPLELENVVLHHVHGKWSYIMYIMHMAMVLNYIMYMASGLKPTSIGHKIHTLGSQFSGIILKVILK